MQLGKYQLVRKLASGGMAEVFLAKAAGPMGFEKTLVLKRILPHLAEDEAFVEMFLGEAKLAAQLNHPNIVQIFDFGEAEGSYFLAMEFIDGPNLRRLIKRAAEQGRALPAAICAKVVAAAAEGLAFAHELGDAVTGEPLGLIHRDVSPENVLVSRQGAVKVVDFGIAKVAGQGHRTQTGVVKGKVAYMPPEQLQAKPMDRRVDVYALGVVLYELLTGRRPFEANTDVSMMQAILFEPFVPAVQRRPDLPVALQGILDKALAKDRDARYPDCRALQGDLERFVLSTGEPVGAYQIAQFVAQVTEGAGGAVATPPPPTPARSAAAGPGAAGTGFRAEGKAGTGEKAGSGVSSMAAPVEKPAAVSAEAGRVTTPVRRLGLADEKVPETAPVARDALEARTDPATPAAGNVVPRPTAREQAVRPMETSPLPAVPSSGGAEGAGAGVSARRRGKLVPALVGGALLLVVGGGVVFLNAGTSTPETSVDGARTSGATSSASTAQVAQVAATPAEPKAEVLQAPAKSEEAQAQVAQAPVGPEALAVPPTGSAAKPEEGERPTSKAGVSAKDLGIVPSGTGSKRPATSIRRTELAKGTVEFRIRPYATVFLDGKSLGQTPFAPIETSAGRHSVKVVNRDLNKEVAQPLDVKAGETTVFKLNLQAE